MVLEIIFLILAVIFYLLHLKAKHSSTLDKYYALFAFLSAVCIVIAFIVFGRSLFVSHL